MAFTDSTAYLDGQATLQREDVGPILDAVQRRSTVLSSFTKLDVGTSQVRIPVLGSLPVVGWVGGDGGLISSTKMAWTEKYINIDKLAAILPVSKDLIADNSKKGLVDIMNTMADKTVEQMALAIDSAVLLGADAPSAFPDDIVTAAIAASNDYQIQATAADGGLSEDQNQALTFLDNQGFYANTGIASKGFYGIASTRSRDGEGRKDPSVVVSRKNRTIEIDSMLYNVADTPAETWGTSAEDPLAIAFDSSQFVVGMREQIQVEVLREAPIYDSSGVLMFNLGTQDMVALKVTMRLGWQVANTVTPDEATEANRYPAALLTRPAS